MISGKLGMCVAACMATASLWAGPLKSGLYSNGRDGFDTSLIALSDDGYCLFSGGVGGACGSWKLVTRDKDTFLHLRLPDLSDEASARENSALLRVVPKEDKLLLVTITNSLEAALAYYNKNRDADQGKRDGRYSFLSEEIPEEITEMIEDFRAEHEKAKKRAEASGKDNQAKPALEE